MFPPYKNQETDLPCEPIDWFYMTGRLILIGLQGEIGTERKKNQFKHFTPFSDMKYSLMHEFKTVWML